jgi:hypothetical protein
LRGHFDCGKASSHYILMKLESEMHWRHYIDIVEHANVVRWEVVVEICHWPRTTDHVDRVDEVLIRIKNLTHGSTIYQTHAHTHTYSIYYQ